MQKKCLCLFGIVAFFFSVILSVNAQTARAAGPKVAVILDTPLVIGDDEKIQEAINLKINEWFPAAKYEVIDVKELQTVVNDYREENDMVVFEENHKTYKPLKIADMQKILAPYNPAYIVNMRFYSGTSKTAVTAFTLRTKVNVVSNIRVINFATGEYLQRYEATNAVGSGGYMSAPSEARSYRKGIIKGLEGFVPDHSKY